MKFDRQKMIWEAILSKLNAYHGVLDKCAIDRFYKEAAGLVEEFEKREFKKKNAQQ